MHPFRLVVALAIAGAVVGCQRDDKGAVLLYLEQRTAGTSAPPSYSSSTAAAAFTGDGLVHLTATSNQGVMRLVLVGPMIDGATIALPPDDERLHFAIGDADWANQGGTIEVLSVDPAIVSFVDVPMVPRTESAVGTFVINGGGTFR